MILQSRISTGVLAMAIASIAAPALAQHEPRSNLAAGIVLKEASLEHPKSFAASLALAVGKWASIEIAGQGIYLSGFLDGRADFPYTARDHEIGAGVRVTPLSTYSAA